MVQIARKSDTVAILVCITHKILFLRCKKGLLDLLFFWAKNILLALSIVGLTVILLQNHVTSLDFSWDWVMKSNAVKYNNTNIMTCVIPSVLFSIPLHSVLHYIRHKFDVLLNLIDCRLSNYCSCSLFYLCTSYLFTCDCIPHYLN